MPGSSVDEALFEGCEGLVDGGLLEEDFGGAAPDHDLAVGFGFELGDVVADLVGEVALVLAGLGLLGGEALDVVLVEDGGHGLDGLEEGANLFELVAVEDLGGLGGVVEVAAEDVPAGEDEVVELGDGDEVLDERGCGRRCACRGGWCPSARVEPMGLARPRRTASTPAMSVVATAPMPGIMTPSFPVAGLMLAAACVAAPGVDMLGGTLLCGNFSVEAEGLVSLTVKRGRKRRQCLCRR